MGGDFGRHTLMDEVENGLRGLKEILYGVSVVGVVVSETYGIYGGTMRLRIYTINVFTGVIIFTCGIFWFDILYTHRCW